MERNRESEHKYGDKRVNVEKSVHLGISYLHLSVYYGHPDHNGRVSDWLTVNTSECQ